MQNFPCNNILIVSNGGGVNAQNVYIDEDFSSELLPTGWSDEKENSSSASWSYANGVAIFDGGNKLGSSAALKTEVFDMSNTNSPVFSFSYSSQHVRGVVDSLVVFWRTDNIEWTPLFTCDELQSTLTDVSFDLTEAQQDEGFQLKFEAWNRYGGEVTIDNVKLMNSIACSTPPTNVLITTLSATSAVAMFTPNENADSSRIVITTSEINDDMSFNEADIVCDTMVLNSLSYIILAL